MQVDLSEVIQQLDSLEEMIHEKVKIGAKKIQKQLANQAQSAIQDFYSYKPKQYDRHKPRGKTYQKYYRDDNNGIIYTGIELAPPNNEYPSVFYSYTKKVMNPSAILDLMWNQGKHGNTEQFPWASRINFFPPVMNPTPRERVEQKRDQILNNPQKYFE